MQRSILNAATEALLPSLGSEMYGELRERRICTLPLGEGGRQDYDAASRILGDYINLVASYSLDQSMERRDEGVMRITEPLEPITDTREADVFLVFDSTFSRSGRSWGSGFARALELARDHKISQVYGAVLKDSKGVPHFSVHQYYDTFQGPLKFLFSEMRPTLNRLMEKDPNLLELFPKYIPGTIRVNEDATEDNSTEWFRDMLRGLGGQYGI